MEQAEMELVWENHTAAEFASKDAEAALKTMVEDPYVRVMANGAGGQA